MLQYWYCFYRWSFWRSLNYWDDLAGRKKNWQSRWLLANEMTKKNKLDTCFFNIICCNTDPDSIVEVFKDHWIIGMIWQAEKKIGKADGFWQMRWLRKNKLDTCFFNIVCCNTDPHSIVEVVEDHWIIRMIWQAEKKIGKADGFLQMRWVTY